MAASGDRELGAADTERLAAEASFERGRRKVLTAGAILVPAIITLHATPAWAGTDYTVTAYRYGTQKGLCRNPDYDPNQSDDECSDEPEFIPCRKGRNRRRRRGNHGGSSNDPVTF